MMNQNHSSSEPVRLGHSNLSVRRVAFGAWPIAGVSSLGVDDAQSIATIQRALDCGVNMIDTAYSYGFDGRSDRIIARAIAGRRDQVVLASKVGGSLSPAGRWQADGRPERLREQTMEILTRLGVERVDLMYLHAPDPDVPLAESADALREILEQGWSRYAGVCNVTFSQAELFHSRCPIVAIQTHFNMLQPERVQELLPFCLQRGIGIIPYWVLMKGILAGKLPRNHRFDPDDRRLNYPIYQGLRWETAQDLLDALRGMACEWNCTVAQLVIAWTLRQPGISAVLAGAKRPDQIEETAQAMKIQLIPEQIARISSLADTFRSRCSWN